MEDNTEPVGHTDFLKSIAELKSENRHRNSLIRTLCGAAACITIFLITCCLGLLAMIVLGSVCLGEENYTYCRTKGGAIAMVVVGSLCCAPIIFGGIHRARR